MQFFNTSRQTTWKGTNNNSGNSVISINNLPEETDAQLKENVPKRSPFATLDDGPTMKAMTVPYQP
jgi:hypothetical protein